MKEKSEIQLALEDLAARLGIKPEQLLLELEQDLAAPDERKAREFAAMATRLWTPKRS